MEYFRKLRFHQAVKSVRDYGIDGMSEPHVVIHTDGACSGNPGPGGWGAILAFGDHEKELKGGEAHTTNNRMELMARDRGAGSAQAAVPGRPPHRQPVPARRHHEMDPRLEAQRLEHRRQEAGQERRPLAAARRGARAPQRATGTGCAATPATPMNERADELAREGIAAIRAGAIGALSSSEPPAIRSARRQQRADT